MKLESVGNAKRNLPPRYIGVPVEIPGVSGVDESVQAGAFAQAVVISKPIDIGF
ncbi:MULTISPECIES: hypothetical protein [unclassified Pigmentiphaga]|uniref:hypothetical protein n=1 Tax=unclassified Pigmentiphaga TaxID=2626614 RepID=UPI0014050259|nr:MULTISPECIES: hypothetical protein [unclassified Pigmentiphaga]